jgi:hypothetical protein
VLGGNEAVNLKDLKMTQDNVMKESVTENKTLTVTGCDIKGFCSTVLSNKTNGNTLVRCYSNNAKKRMQTNLKDVKSTQKIVMKQSVTENKTLTDTGCGIKGFCSTVLSNKTKRSTVVRCYSNNAKKRMQTSESFGSQVCLDLKPSIFDGRWGHGYGNTTPSYLGL